MEVLVASIDRRQHDEPGPEHERADGHRDPRADLLAELSRLRRQRSMINVAGNVAAPAASAL